MKKSTRPRAASSISDTNTALSADTQLTESSAKNGLLSPPETHPLPVCDLSASDVMSSVEAQWLPIIYRESWEAIFGSWMGKYSCPFTFV